MNCGENNSRSRPLFIHSVRMSDLILVLKTKRTDCFHPTDVFFLFVPFRESVLRVTLAFLTPWCVCYSKKRALFWNSSHHEVARKSASDNVIGQWFRVTRQHASTGWLEKTATPCDWKYWLFAFENKYIKNLSNQRHSK